MRKMTWTQIFCIFLLYQVLLGSGYYQWQNDKSGYKVEWNGVFWIWLYQIYNIEEKHFITITKIK